MEDGTLRGDRTFAMFDDQWHMVPIDFGCAVNVGIRSEILDDLDLNRDAASGFDSSPLPCADSNDDLL